MIEVNTSRNHSVIGLVYFQRVRGSVVSSLMSLTHFDINSFSMTMFTPVSDLTLFAILRNPTLTKNASSDSSSPTAFASVNSPRSNLDFCPEWRPHRRKGRSSNNQWRAVQLRST